MNFIAAASKRAIRFSWPSARRIFKYAVGAGSIYCFQATQYRPARKALANCQQAGGGRQLDSDTAGGGINSATGNAAGTDSKIEERVVRWPNGRVHSIARIVNGELHGRQQGWYSGGQPSYDSGYEHNKQHGRQQAWYEGGQLCYDFSFERGLQHGRQQRWYPDGQPLYDENFGHGVRHGRVREWDGQGNLTTDAWYVHGVIRDQ